MTTKRHAHMDGYEGRQAVEARSTRPIRLISSDSDAIYRPPALPGLPPVVAYRRPQSHIEAALAAQEPELPENARRKDLEVFTPGPERQDTEWDRWKTRLDADPWEPYIEPRQPTNTDLQPIKYAGNHTAGIGGAAICGALAL